MGSCRSQEECARPLSRHDVDQFNGDGTAYGGDVAEVSCPIA
jgi:hypothetical protein